jgi:hypothetical protein
MELMSIVVDALMNHIPFIPRRVCMVESLARSLSRKKDPCRWQIHHDHNTPLYEAPYTMPLQRSPKLRGWFSACLDESPESNSTHRHAQ